MLYRTTPACSPEVEAIVEKTIASAFRVHTTLGPGYKEMVYHDAFALDLRLEGYAANANTELTCSIEVSACGHTNLILSSKELSSSS